MNTAASATPWPTCVLPACRSRPGPDTEQADGTLCCWNCGQKLRQLVRDIDSYLRVLDGRPRTRANTGPRRPGYHSRPPADLGVLALTDPRTRDDRDEDRIPNVLGTLHAWATGVVRACPDAAHRSTATLGDVLIVLLIHTSWIAAQPVIAQYAEDLAFVHGTLRRAAGDGPPPPAAICACGGPIWLQERTHTAEDGTREVHGMARCTSCGTAYTALDLVKLHTAKGAANVHQGVHPPR